MPKISVIIPSYNCARFLTQAVNSVLRQSHEDLEIIIVDDASTDDSATIIRGIEDARVKTIFLPTNTGGAAALNVGIQNTKSPLISLCNADDEWLPTKLASQLSHLDGQKVAAVFSHVSWIDEAGRIRTEAEVPFFNVFAIENMARNEWLQTLYKENRLCHPSVLIERRVYDECGLYDNRLRQIPDFDMWLRVIQKFDIFVIQEKLVRFRLLADSGNTSALTPANSVRGANEMAIVLERFFRSLSKEQFVGAFGSRKDPADDDFCLLLEKVFFLATKKFSLPTMFCSIASKLLYEFLADPVNYKAVESYGQNYEFIHQLNGISSPYQPVRALASFTAQEQQRLLDWAGLPDVSELSSILPESQSVSITENNESERTKLRTKLDDARKTIQQKEDRVSELKVHIRQLENSVSEANAQQNAMKAALDASSEQVRVLKSEITELKSELERMGNSKSWKLTAPLRGFRSKIR